MSAMLWLLERCGVDRSLAGDVVEERRAGRSLVWCGWQAAVAIVLAITRGVSQHKLLAIRAVGIGLVVARALQRFVTGPLALSVFYMSIQHGLRVTDASLLYMLVAVPVMKGVRLTAVGWLIGRLHRPHAVPMVAALASMMALWNAPSLYTETYRLLVDTATNARFLPYLSANLLNITVSLSSLGLGALIGEGPPHAHQERL